MINGSHKKKKKLIKHFEGRHNRKMLLKDGPFCSGSLGGSFWKAAHPFGKAGRVGKKAGFPSLKDGSLGVARHCEAVE